MEKKRRGSAICRDRKGRFFARTTAENGWTEERRAAFLAHLAVSSNVRASVRKAGMTKSSLYRLRDRDIDFRKQWEDALAEGYALLEMEMLHRARFGTSRETIERDGEDVVQRRVVTREYGDGCALRLLAQHRMAVNFQRAAAGMAAIGDDERTTAAGLAQLRVMLAEMREREADDAREGA